MDVSMNHKFKVLAQNFSWVNDKIHKKLGQDSWLNAGTENGTSQYE
jgi:hypothetical protein